MSNGYRTFRIEGNQLIIDLNLESTEPSKSGKSYLLATSNGFKHDNASGIDVSFNVIKKKP